MKYRVIVAAACALSAAAIQNAWGQEAALSVLKTRSTVVAADNGGSGKAQASSSLEEVVVTAERRSENIQRAPLSITALNGQDLQDAGKVTLDNALSSVASVRIQGASNGAQIYIRGVGSNADSQLGDPAVNLNFDGIYQGETEAAMAGLYDVQRIEVLRGPQGTLYGRNATAGAVNVITNDPTQDKEGYVNAQVGNYSAVTLQAMANTPLSDDLAMRVAMSSQSHSGYLSDGNDDEGAMSGRLKLLYTPTDRLRILLSGQYTHIRDNGFGTVEAPLSGDPYDSTKPKGYRRINAWDAHAKIDYDLDWTTLTLEAGHSNFAKLEDNVLLSPGGAADRRSGRQNSVELRAASIDSSWIKWVAGLYYLDDDEFKEDIATLIAAPAAPANNPELRLAGTKSYAAFTNVTVPLSDWLRLTGGLRYTNDRKTANYVYTDGSGTPDVNESASWDSLTYKAGIEADVAPNSLLYAQVSSGFKAGGFSQQFPAASYNPEKLTAYEAGSKNTFIDDTLSLNGSVFYYTYKNYQASYPDIVGGSFALVTSNAASAKLYGADLEMQWKVSPYDTIALSGSYLHSKFGDFTYTSVLTGPVDHSHQTLPQSPELSGDVSYEHVFNLSNGGAITGHANMHWTKGYWTTVERTLDAYQSAFTRTDAYLMYQPPDENWNVRIYVNNLENHPVRTLGLQNPFDAVLMLAPPRTFGVGAGITF